MSETPFALGMEGEFWDDRIPALMVPLPNTDPPLHVIVVENASGYSIVTNDQWHHFDTILMTAAVVTDIINSYHRR